MKRILLLFSILGMLLTSCIERSVISVNSTQIVRSVTNYPTEHVNSANTCLYTVSSDKLDGTFYLIDTCGKYNIGDTLIVSKP